MFLTHYIGCQSNIEYNAKSLSLRLKCQEHKNRHISLRHRLRFFTIVNDFNVRPNHVMITNVCPEINKNE